MKDNKNKTVKAFMAIAAGSESKESNRKLYIGVAPVFVAGVNPSKEEINAFFNIETENEPEYVGEGTVGRDDTEKTVPQVRIDFLVVSNAEKCNGIEMKTRIPFFLKKYPNYNNELTKVKVIDKYGQTAWASMEEAKVNAIPQYANGPAKIDKDYRPAFVGEEELTNFIKRYLNIPMPSFSFKDSKTGETVVRTLKNPDDALARLDNIESYFKGDFSELNSILKLQPKNQVKAMFGVRSTEDNKQYQAVYNHIFLKNSTTDYSKLDEDLQNRKNAGAYPTTEFSVEVLHEYDVTPTDFSAQEPVADSANTPWSWTK